MKLSPVRLERVPPHGGLWHEFANIFPMLEARAVEDLQADIAEHGVLEPVVFFEERVLDGRNRFFAARNLNIAYPRVDFEGTPAEALAFVVSKNLKRRHLSESQRAMIASNLAKLPAHRIPADLRTSMSQAEAAAALNVSERLVSAAKAVTERGVPELLDAVTAGSVSVSAAAEVVTLPTEEQAAVVASGPEAVQAKAAELRLAPMTKTPAELCIEILTRTNDGRGLGKFGDDFASVRHSVTAEGASELRSCIAHLRMHLNRLERALDAEHPLPQGDRDAFAL